MSERCVLALGSWLTHQGELFFEGHDAVGAQFGGVHAEDAGEER
jgi:hypothetical protein